MNSPENNTSTSPNSLDSIPVTDKLDRYKARWLDFNGKIETLDMPVWMRAVLWITPNATLSFGALAYFKAEPQGFIVVSIFFLLIILIVVLPFICGHRLNKIQGPPEPRPKPPG